MRIGSTWTPKVCRMLDYVLGSWAIMLPTFGGLGRVRGVCMCSPACMRGKSKHQMFDVVMRA